MKDNIILKRQQLMHIYYPPKKEIKKSLVQELILKILVLVNQIFGTQINQNIENWLMIF